MSTPAIPFPASTPEEFHRRADIAVAAANSSEAARLRDAADALEDSGRPEVFYAGKIPPASQRKPLDINDVVALLAVERKHTRSLTQRLYKHIAALEEAAQFLGDFQTDDVDRPKWAAEALEFRLRTVLEAEE